MLGFPSFFGFGIRGRSYSNFLASTVLEEPLVVDTCKAAAGLVYIRFRDGINAVSA